MRTTKRFLLTLVAMIGMTGAWAQDVVTVTPTANANEWTLTMPAGNVELEIEYYEPVEDVVANQDPVKTSDYWCTYYNQIGRAHV